MPNLDEIYKYKDYEPADGMAGIIIDEQYMEITELLEKVYEKFNKIESIVMNDKRSA